MLKLDKRDIEILKILSREARISKADLAKRVSLSPSPVWTRLERLEKAGLIRGYHADIALQKLFPFVTVFVTVELDRHSKDSLDAFEQLVQGFEEIAACWALGGGFDYLIHIVAADIDAYQRLMDRLLETGPKIARYYTYVVTKPVKSGGGVPFAALMAGADETPPAEEE